MTAPTTTPAAEQYLADVEQELADLPADERTELLEDLGLHLAALEEEADERPLSARLGSPAAYATELRAAAGLPERSAASASHRRLALQGAARRVTETRAFREVRGFAPQLRPAWWVLRGYLVVLLPRLWHIDGTRDFPVPALLGNHLVGGAAVALAIVMSVMLGRRRLPRFGTVAVLALDVIILLGAVNLLHDAQWRSDRHQFVYVESSGGNPFVDSPLVTEAHGAVTNILAFDANGKPLQGVLLFDQDGRPLTTGQQRWFADHCRRVLNPPRALDGTPVTFSYPKMYALDPEGRSLSGMMVTPGQCKALPTPKVTLPLLTKPATPKTAASAAPSPR